MIPPVSLHGGHSSPVCAHADGSLEAIVQAAIRAGMTHYGVTEHAPKSRLQDLDEDEAALELTPPELHARYRTLVEEEIPRLQARYGDRLQLLVGLETDTLPADSFAQRMATLRRSYRVEYLVGSVHHVDDLAIDADPETYRRAAEACGDEEQLHLRYYATQARLLEALRPEVVGHLDLIRKFAASAALTDPLRAAVDENLERIRDLDLLLEINPSPLRAGHAAPYPTVEILGCALRRGVRITFGDDAHGPTEVAGGLRECARVAREVGFSRFWFFHRTAGGELRRTACGL